MKSLLIALVVAALAGLRATEPAEQPDGRQAPAPSPADLSRLMEMTRDEVEALLGNEAEDISDGWLQYRPTLAVRYREGRVDEVAVIVPEGLTCSEAVAWAGFPDAAYGLRTADGCEWPGISLMHRLAPDLAASLNLETAHLHVWRRKPEQPQRQ